ncbi:hypothetical protein [Calothrix sp. PCC 7507]|uniref:hypothetical protein n=1 Tax=Calothrix sp. PCC 7507 TaxID=99598 RepID=UPI00029F2BF2|nr:hypothetical protein [Calothrix sp. PCC 7507]AFY34336.1 hypothetical protein Cal7507_3949 [Calothrix sp. PCC 7507]
MKKLLLPFTKLAVAIVAGIGFAPLLVAQPSLADSLGNSFPSNNSEENNNNPLSPGSSDFNMFDLIHRANFGNINWNDSEQNQKLDEAAEAYKKIQQQRFQNSQNNAVPGSPSTEPSANKPSPGN